ncbi:MAG: helix-turn-helix transcriptional regulator [Roseburia sp.]|nr:helix-turn-helix transcriptional regulator [Roseburia sp.]
MALSYNRMWKLLVDKKMSKADLRKAADIAPNTMTKLRRDEAVNLAILGRICNVLGCDFGDIMEYVPESNMNKDLVVDLDFDTQSKTSLQKNLGEKNDWRFFAIS